MEKTITFTFGDAGENHTGMQMIGEKLGKGSGFNEEDLRRIKVEMEKKGKKCELVDLREIVDEEDVKECKSRVGLNRAFVLIVREFLGKEEADALYEENEKLVWDKQYYCVRRKKVLNKHARHNLMYSDEEQLPEYESKKGRIVAWSQVPELGKLKGAIKGLNEVSGGKTSNLICEGNLYYKKGTGIGWHGDTERSKVVALRVGKSMSLCYKWWMRHKSRGKLFSVELNHEIINLRFLLQKILHSVNFQRHDIMDILMRY